MTKLHISPDLSLPLEGDIQQRLQEIRDGMEIWYRDINGKRTTRDQLGRTAAEQCFDSGVFVASEFIRRLTGSDGLSLAVHSCLVKKAEMDELMAQSKASKRPKKSTM